MNSLPQPAWAILLAILGVVLTIIGYVYPGSQTAQQAVFQIAAALVSGALGAFAGRASHSDTTTTKTTINAPSTED